MSPTYTELLDVTIQHLEALKSRGVRHVAVANETLRALASPVTRRNLELRIQNPEAVINPPEPQAGSRIRP